MCGINGIFSNEIINSIESRIQNMNTSLLHRGPDDEGYIINNNMTAFGHRRLSIIDLESRAKQPMVSNSKRWTIVFNGEIYNFKELKQDLDYTFRTESDTEVILGYVEQHGFEEFLRKSNGMFSIALFDSFDNRLFLARDRFGIKPLFFYLDKNKIIFSSEIKGILNSGLVKADFFTDVIDEYLGNRYIREPYTFFKNIFQLESATMMIIDRDFNVRKSTYWELPTEFNNDIKYDEFKIQEEFKTKLIESIRKRLISDVPLGTYLSGGLDSSIITAITSKFLCRGINTYTIGFSGMNEFEFARLVAEEYSTDHHEIIIDIIDYFKTLTEVINIKDAPLGVPNEVSLALMSKILKEKITVVLSGEGADELMGGYGKIFRTPFDFKNHGVSETSFYNYFIGKYEYVPRSLRDKYLIKIPKLRKVYDDQIISEFQGKSNEENVFRFFHKYHIKGLLNRVDTTTMLAGVEARVPFLDHELVEFVYKKVPYDMKLRWKDSSLEMESKKLFSEQYSEINDIPKYLLRKIGYDFLPREIVERRKVGFPVPLNEWIQSLEQKARNVLSDASWLKCNKLDDLLAESKHNLRAGQIIWMFINVEIFRKLYFLKEWRY